MPLVNLRAQMTVYSNINNVGPDNYTKDGLPAPTGMRFVNAGQIAGIYVDLHVRSTLGALEIIDGENPEYLVGLDPYATNVDGVLLNGQLTPPHNNKVTDNGIGVMLVKPNTTGLTATFKLFPSCCVEVSCKACADNNNTLGGCHSQ
eukprot:3726205-Prymnesium_polylepis.1